MNNSITVVITTHNRIDLLKRAIKSVQNQTVQPLEIIVVDDCSSDETYSYLTIETPNLVKPITLSNPSGANVARNRGIDCAEGEYVAFLDDDDYWDPSKLSQQLTMMRRQDASFSYTGLNTMTPSGKSLKQRFYLPTDPTNVHHSLMVNNFIGSTSSIMVKKSFCNEFNIRFDEALGSMQDYDFYLSCFAYTNKLAPVEACLTFYHQERSLFLKKTSSSYTHFANARSYMLQKYHCDPDILHLKKALDTVRFKKCLKYPLFFLGLVGSLKNFKRK